MFTKGFINSTKMANTVNQSFSINKPSCRNLEASLCLFYNISAKISLKIWMQSIPSYFQKSKCELLQDCRFSRGRALLFLFPSCSSEAVPLTALQTEHFSYKALGRAGWYCTLLCWETATLFCVILPQRHSNIIRNFSQLIPSGCMAWQSQILSTKNCVIWAGFEISLYFLIQKKKFI